jgi:putative endopeptidase
VQTPRLVTRRTFATTLALAGAAGLALASRDSVSFTKVVARFAVPSARAAENAPEYAPWGFDLTGLDRKVKPGDSFYDFANGLWDARTEIPSDKSRWGVFDMLRDRSQLQVRAIIEDAAKSGASPDSEAGKIGALYNSYMDEARIEMLDASPIQADLARVRETKTKDDIAALMGRSKTSAGASLFGVGVTEDAKDPMHHTLSASQSGLGLPDRDYYLRDSFKDKKAKYHEYIAHMLEMVGWPQPQQRADAILAFETQIAEASWSRAESRDRDKTYNPMSPAELDVYAPGFQWSAWLGAADVGKANRVVVRQNTAFPKLAKIFAEVPVETLQAWEAFHIVDQSAYYLSKRFADAHFQFRNRELNGQPEERPRWQRATQLVSGVLGEAVGKVYVERYFPPQSKTKMDELVREVRKALRGRIENLSWMTPATKAKALEKLELMGVKIGYPNKWRDYSALKIEAADLMGNVRRSGAFRWDIAVDKLNKPVDPEEWGMTPQTVNAYYTSTRNEIVFPAAILQAPFFDPNADMAVNYGGIGAVIGHELTHGFDDQGRKSDGHGVLTDWWQPADAEKFQAEADKFGAQYEAVELAPGVRVKAALTMGENIADLGGLLVALDAYRDSLHGQPAPVLDGFTGEQRVFLGFAQVWRSKSRLDALKQQVATDPHSPVRLRVEGPMRNIDAWYRDFDVKAGEKLYLKPEERVHIW